MTRQEMESTVANLLLEQRRLKSLGTQLPPDKLSLLQRLLYRLGYTKMSRTNPKRYSDGITNYSSEHTEEHFQNHLDEHPDDHHARMIFADWLDDHNDPRAEGYRALGQLQKSPSQSIFHPEGGTWLWAHENNALGNTTGRYINSKLPTKWLALTQNSHPQYGHLPTTINPVVHWRYHTSRREADDAAALAFGKLGKRSKEAITKRTRMSRKPLQYARLTLSQPKPGVSFGGEPLNEHDLHDESGKVVGNIKVRDRGSMLHVDWIGGKGFAAHAGGLGNEAMRSIHDAIAEHYPKAQYLTGHRISGFRGKQTTGERVVVPIRRRNVKMSRQSPKRYAKFNTSTPAHPLVQGFPIEHALRHIANHPQSTDDAKNLAVAVLKGKTEALWGLHDELQTSEHPILKAGYKWLNAADKLHLDKHTYTALEEAAARHRAGQPHAPHRNFYTGVHVWHYTPEHQAINAGLGISASDSSLLARNAYENIHARVKQLSPHSTDEDINESIQRHAHRAVAESSRRLGMPSPDEGEQKRALSHPSENKKPEGFQHKNEVATRYKKYLKKYSLANKSNFIGSLLKVSSPEHKMFVKRTKQLARQAGAKQTKEFPALHDTPQQSVPGVALAVYGHIQPDNAHALGSWVNGLLPNSPGYAVFHARPTGPDTLYRIRMEGSGHDARAKLDRSGINSRIFVPHRKGLDILIPDKGSQMGQLVQIFAAQQKVPIEASQGHLTTVGSQDQAQARDTFRGKVVTAENKMSRNARRVNLKRYAIKVDKPSGGRPSNPLRPEVAPPKHAKEFQYEPGLLPPTERDSKKPLPPGAVPTLPKGVKQKEWNPTVVPPKEKPLFSAAEYNRLHAWAHKHAYTHTPEFAKFLGLKTYGDGVHELLVKALVHAAHEMRRTGTNTATAKIGDTGKRIKINTPRTSWVNVKTQSKTVKLPEGAEPAPRIPLKDVRETPKKKKLDRYSRRRLSLSTFSLNLDYQLGA